MLRFIRETEREEEGEREKEREIAVRARRGEATLRTTFTATCYKCLLLLASFGCCCCCCCLSGFSCFFLCSLLARLAFGLWQNLQLLAAAAVAAAKFYLSRVASVAYIWQVNVVWGGQEKKPRPDAQPISSRKPKRKPTTQRQPNQAPADGFNWVSFIAFYYTYLLYTPWFYILDIYASILVFQFCFPSFFSLSLAVLVFFSSLFTQLLPTQLIFFLSKFNA